MGSDDESAAWRAIYWFSWVVLATFAIITMLMCIFGLMVYYWHG